MWRKIHGLTFDTWNLRVFVWARDQPSTHLLPPAAVTSSQNSTTNKDFVEYSAEHWNLIERSPRLSNIWVTIDKHSLDSSSCVSGDCVHGDTAHVTMLSCTATMYNVIMWPSTRCLPGPHKAPHRHILQQVLCNFWFWSLITTATPCGI